MSCADLGVMSILHPGNISTGDVTEPTAASAASPASPMVWYEPQPVPQWLNATQVNILPRDAQCGICCDAVSVCPSVCLPHACIVSKSKAHYQAVSTGLQPRDSSQIKSSKVAFIITSGSYSLRTPNMEHISLEDPRRGVLKTCNVTRLHISHKRYTI